jgi:phosphopantothenoylcysteine decarboxylase/phosphopantothenate--cysteine ligase
MSNKKSVLLVVTGSISAFKALDLLSLLKKNNYSIDIVLTESASKFIPAMNFNSLNDTPIYNDMFDVNLENEIGHIELSRKNDCVLIFPATANFIAKIAHGIADDLASTVVLASNKKIFISPAMNVEMWHNELTQENIKTLENKGVEILYPDSGKMACNEIGEGKLTNEVKAFEALEEYLKAKKSLQGKKILITTGGTREKIDDVRYIGNFSSGKQGIAIARKLKEIGAIVTIIKANTNCHIPSNFNITNVETAEEMLEETLKEIEKNDYDAAFFTAAVADFKAKNKSPGKIKKENLSSLTIELEKNPDILLEVSKHKNRPKKLIGFAAESQDKENNIINNAYKKLESKNCDHIVLNDVSEGRVFEKDESEVILINKDRSQNTIKGTKRIIALKLIELLF